MTIMVLLDFDIKEGKLEEFLKILEETLPDTRSYNGCLFLKTCVYEEQNKICLVEEWETKKHQQAYFKDRVESGIIEEVMQFLTEPPIATYYEKRSE